jgi:hypothetical protein
MSSEAPADRNELFVGYTLLSNSFNATSGFSGNILNGWDAAFMFPLALAERLGIQTDAFGYYGTSRSDPVREHNIVAGPQYWLHRGRTRIFVHGLVGLGYLNSGAMPFDTYHGPSSNWSFAALAGGGLDHNLTRHVALRLEGDMLHTNFTSPSDQIHGLPNFFGRFATGLVFRF